MHFYPSVSIIQVKNDEILNFVLYTSVSCCAAGLRLEGETNASGQVPLDKRPSGQVPSDNVTLGHTLLHTNAV